MATSPWTMTCSESPGSPSWNSVSRRRNRRRRAVTSTARRSSSGSRSNNDCARHARSVADGTGPVRATSPQPISASDTCQRARYRRKCLGRTAYSRLARTACCIPHLGAATHSWPWLTLTSGRRRTPPPTRRLPLRTPSRRPGPRPPAPGAAHARTDSEVAGRRRRRTGAGHLDLGRAGGRRRAQAPGPGPVRPGRPRGSGGGGHHAHLRGRRRRAARAAAGPARPGPGEGRLGRFGKAAARERLGELEMAERLVLDRMGVDSYARLPRRDRGAPRRGRRPAGPGLRPAGAGLGPHAPGSRCRRSRSHRSRSPSPSRSPRSPSTSPTRPAPPAATSPDRPDRYRQPGIRSRSARSDVGRPRCVMVQEKQGKATHIC